MDLGAFSLSKHPPHSNVVLGENPPTTVFESYGFRVRVSVREDLRFGGMVMFYISHEFWSLLFTGGQMIGISFKKCHCVDVAQVIGM